MKIFFGYLRTIGQYLKTPKGRHDTLDYLRAAFLAALTMAAAYLLFSYFLY